jgi:hypothetical protein
VFLRLRSADLFIIAFAIQERQRTARTPGALILSRKPDRRPEPSMLTFTILFQEPSVTVTW